MSGSSSAPSVRGRKRRRGGAETAPTPPSRDAEDGSQTTLPSSEQATMPSPSTQPSPRQDEDPRSQTRQQQHEQLEVPIARTRTHVCVSDQIYCQLV